MQKKSRFIPVNKMTGHFGEDISIERISFDELCIKNKADPGLAEEANQSHRHDCHSFFLLESGTVNLEIDFKRYKIKAPSVIYIHPDQVHRTELSGNVIVSSLAINNEKLDPAYLKLLEDITPAKPLSLAKETFSLFSEAVSLCLKFSTRKSDKLYDSSLKDGCNALVTLVLSQYLEQSASTGKFSRFENISKAFKRILECNYITEKRPAAYARDLNLSTSYLNEAVKSTTGYSVSYHIRQRTILEAKRLLYYSDKSVKEIAAALGYDDYPYFARLFTKECGMTAFAFRNKNRG